jgi:uncharacterized protein (TIGR03437 family)
MNWKPTRKFVLWFSLSIAACQAWSQPIITFAGTGSPGFASGDGGSAISANIGTPVGLAVDAVGNVYIADSLNQQIRKVDTSGKITLFAGGGVAAPLGDGGPAVHANIQFAGPHSGMAFDKAGNMYVTDVFHHSIRKIDTNGIITTFAGTGTRGFGGDGGPATSAQLAAPQGVTVDGAGNVYIADTSNGRVRKVDLTGTIKTVAGNGVGSSLNDGGPATGTLFVPMDVAVDGTGNLYIADTRNNVIRKVSNGIITSLGAEYLATVCDSGHAGMAPVDGLTLDAAGDIFTAESLVGCVHKIDPYGDFVIVAGGGTNIPGDNGPATAAALTGVDAVARDQAGNIYIAEEHASLIRKVLAPPPFGTAPATAPVITSVQNAFGGSTSIAPNMWVAIKGTNLAPPNDSRIWAGSDFVDNLLPAELDGVMVTFNGASAYVYYISPTQVNVLSPPDPITGPVEVRLSVNGVASAPVMVQMALDSPSFFTFDGVHVVGTHLNGSLLGPTSLYPGLSAPARPGETVILYANGFGLTDKPAVRGLAAQSGNLLFLPGVMIGSASANVGFSGLISPGLYQFNVTIPPSTPSGDIPLSATVILDQTQAGVKITVQQ